MIKRFSVIYVGQIDLENVGGQDILAVYTQLGLELQEELKRLKLSGDNERLALWNHGHELLLCEVLRGVEAVLQP